MPRNQGRARKKSKALKIVLAIVLVFVAAIAGFGFSVYHNINKTAKNIHSPLDRTPAVSRSGDLSLKNKEPFSVLMLGVDERPGDRGRSDTMIVLTVNPKLESIDMLSIPRDTRVEIVGRGTEDKINHAYAFGGVEMSMDSVEKFLDIPIDYYVKMNMEGFQEVVDAVGGITVNNDLDFSLEGNHFSKGQIDLNGKEALAYARMRKEDPRGDFGRQLRQRQVIQGVMSKGASVSAIWKYDDVLSALGNNVKTNLTLSDMNTIQKNYKGVQKNIEQYEVEGQGTKIGGIYYYIVAEQERNRLQGILKEHLNM